MARYECVIFDLDGTLIDSDDALVEPFVRLGVPREQISFGHAIVEECERLGISVDRYVEFYDTDVVDPFPGVEDLVSSLGRWAVCSNKHPVSGRAELARLGWTPEGAWFADAFDGRPKELGPVLSGLGVDAGDVLFVGDTAHDLRCATDVGCDFRWAGWNPRVDRRGDDVVDDVGQLLQLLR